MRRSFCRTAQKRDVRKTFAGDTVTGRHVGVRVKLSSNLYSSYSKCLQCVSPSRSRIQHFHRCVDTRHVTRGQLARLKGGQRYNFISLAVIIYSSINGPVIGLHLCTPRQLPSPMLLHSVRVSLPCVRHANHRQIDALRAAIVR